MTGPSISVVIPTYNRSAFLATAVASIRTQTYPCAEIIIVDDGSTDDTAQVTAALGAGIRYVRQANAGPAAARNRGIREARGDWVAFLDTDDRWLPEKLCKQVEIVRRDPSITLVSADMAIEDDEGVCWMASNFAHRGLQSMFADLDGGPVPNAPALLLKINYINTSTVLARRDVLLKMNGFDERLRFGEDLELWLRIAAMHSVACVPSVQEIRVEHASNVTKSIEPMLLGYIQLAEVIREWATDLMPQWGVRADHYVANCLADLGYWYFSEGRLAEARQLFDRSLQEAITGRALIYRVASATPTFVIKAIRRTKFISNQPKLAWRKFTHHDTKEK